MNKIIVIFFVIHSVISSEKFLQFRKHDEVTDRRSIYELDQVPLNIDAFQNSQVLIRFIQYIPGISFPNVQFFCHVKTLNENYKIVKAQFCKKVSLSAKGDCHTIDKNMINFKLDYIMKFDINFDSSFGFTASLNMEISSIVNRSKPFDGFYYCTLHNLLGSIQSNYIEFQDYEFYKKKIVSLIKPFPNSQQVKRTNDITTNSFPLYFDCGKSMENYEHYLPKWINKALLSTFDWSLCPNAISGVHCYTKILDRKEKKSHILDDFINYYQFPNGTIILMDIRGTEYVSSGLICSPKSIAIKPYVIYLVANNAGWRSIKYLRTPTYAKKIQKMSPEYENIVVREGRFQAYRFKLSAVYVAHPDHTKISTEWRKNKYSLPSSFEQGPYKLTFPLEVTEAHSGIYVLKVQQSDPYDSATFTFNVTVVGVPKLKEVVKHPSILYRTVDQTVNFSVSFEKNILKKGVEINNVNIDFSSEENKDKSLKELSFQYPFLTGIVINGNLEHQGDSGKIQYEAKGLMTNKNANQPKTHTVTFIAENDIGVSKASFLIRVFENPVFLSYPNEFNCTNGCSHNEEHRFTCSIDVSEYKAEGCTIKYLWTLNHLSLNSMNEGYIQKLYFQILNDTVVLKPINTDNAVNDNKMIKMLTNATLSCQIIIYEPSEEVDQPSSTILYSTSNYHELKSVLEAKIQLTVPSTSLASTQWILPLIISLIVLIILVVLILYFCLRGSGETYNVDQKERAQGHDPEKEIIDNEIFQPYERDHETNVIQPRQLSFNDDDSVGVGSDDGELDVYDIDPGKFNEEGSFIGQYASDPRKHKANNVA